MEKGISLSRVSQIVEKHLTAKKQEIENLFSELSENCLREVMQESGLTAIELAECGGLELSNIIGARLNFIYIDSDMKASFKIVKEQAKIK